MKKTILYYGFIVIVIVMTLYSISGSQDLPELGRVLLMANPWYAGAALALMFSFWIWDALIVHYLSHRLQIASSFSACLRYAMVGQYYNLITPMASGGLPVQIYIMSSRGPYSITDAGSILVNKYVVFQTLITLYGAFFLIFELDFVLAQASGVYVWVFIGLALNLILVPGMLILAYNHNALLALMRFVATLLTRLHLLRWFSPERIESGINNFVMDINRMQKDWRMVCTVSLMTFAQLTCYFAISFCVCRALGQNSLRFIDIIALQAILYTAVHFIPTPGNAGASEGAFYVLFKAFFPEQLIYAGLLLWRIAVYYFALLITGIVTFYDHAFRPVSSSTARRLGNPGQS